ncbi:hypothetical protein AB0M10_15305 [Streptomyces sp. NPDC051840]|uniref:hypothetical protein n=1 Tax=Streptomyces sp. NPDC051840 TaxID=3154752 RepID=UPI00342AB33E
MTIPTLMVPELTDGTPALVLAVNGVAPEPCGPDYYLVTHEGVTLRLPPALRLWAAELLEHWTRRECLMPAVYRFTRRGGVLSVEHLPVTRMGW